MGRLLFFLVASIFILLIILVVNSYNQRKETKKNTMTHKEKRESFDSDIEAVAKEIKKRQTI